jgi:hypothetical protein
MTTSGKKIPIQVIAGWKWNGLKNGRELWKD